MPTYTIGQLAQKAGVNVETIRYYQRLKLLHEPPKPPGGYRRYPEAIIARLRFIKRAQGLGFSLKEVADLLSLDDGNCTEARALAEHKLVDVKRRLDDLNTMRRALRELIEQCRVADESTGRCALIDKLSADRD